jgi:hypothetical protein
VFSGFDINVTPTFTNLTRGLLPFPNLAAQVDHEVDVFTLSKPGIATRVAFSM